MENKIKSKQSKQSKQRRYCPYTRTFVEGQPCADKNEYHSRIL